MIPLSNCKFRTGSVMPGLRPGVTRPQNILYIKKMPPIPGGIFCFKGRPVSRVLCRCVSCERILHRARHLSCPVIADAVIRPTPRLGRAALGHRYTWSFNPSGVRLPVSPPGPVSSYLTFSPLPRQVGAVLFCYTAIPFRISSR